jgi:TorA maturation chaperone TorD
LVDLRAFLLSQGLARQQAVSEPEDHIAAVYEVMRHLILQSHASMDAQREFFRNTIWPGVPRLCAALQASEHAQLFKAVARLASAFAELENAAFEML